MAVTKIWPIKDNLKRVVSYAANPDKTEYDDLKNALHYAGDRSKTDSYQGAERSYFVSGINCRAETAYEEMRTVKSQFGKTGGNVAYHAYMSFAPGEVTPQQCHHLGVQLARNLWGDRFQVLVATHMDKNHLHNHLVLNSVSFVDGKKFNCAKSVYYELRAMSDKLCDQNSLSVVKNPKGKTPRSIYFAEKNGEPTKHNLMREAIDAALKITSTGKDFTQALREQGYIVNADPNRKYATLRRIGDEKAMRMYRLGESYDVAHITERLRENRYNYGSAMYHRAQEPIAFRAPARQRKYRGSFKTMKKATGLYALYLHYRYLLGGIPKRNSGPRPLSPQMREAVRHMDKLTRQMRLIADKHLKTDVDVQALISANTITLNNLKIQRDSCYNHLRRCDDGDAIREIKAQRDELTAQMALLRGENRLAASIPVSTAEMRRNIRTELAMRTEKRERERALFNRSHKKRGREK